MMKKKGQLSLGDAPTIVLLVGLVFLVMATIAFIGEKYGDAMPTTARTITNETVTQTELGANSTLDGANGCRATTFAITQVRNDTTSTILLSNNYSLDAPTGAFTNNSSWDTTHDWLVDYTYVSAGIGCNVTDDLGTEISNNSSIAGIVLTISLIGIVLSVLIGVFLSMRARRV